MNNTILVADDSPLQAIMLRRTLTQAGFEVTVVKNGMEALDLLKQRKIDLIISDVNMPKLDGYELCRSVKQHPDLAQIPFILCTSLSDPNNLIKGIEVGANNYITKPWDDESLISLVKELLQFRSSHRFSSSSQEEVVFNGKSYKIQSGYQEVINFLLSTYQNIHKQNEELKSLQEELKKAYAQLELNQKEQEHILLNIFPESVAQELVAYGTVEPIRYEEATVMFVDCVEFSKSALQTNPQDLVGALGFYFEKFDDIINHRNLERIKTIGDGYMCVGGVPKGGSAHAIDCILAALDIRKFIEECRSEIQAKFHVSWSVRLGIHSGPVIAGVFGKKRLAYDIWGETVNLASRMETYSEPNKINISASTYAKIKDLFVCQSRGSVMIQNKKGVEEVLMDMYFVEGIKPNLNLK